MTRHQLRIKVPVGRIETVIEHPDGERRGLALIAHPHPLHGGTLDNKVAWTLARAVLACGYVAVRPNFRGVGESEGEFDHGEGESDDLVALAQSIGRHYPGLDWTLLGFSFGAYVQHRVAGRIPATRLIMVGPAVSMYAFDPPPVPAVILHGEFDELIPLDAVRAYAVEYGIPLHVVPGAGHFFHGRLKELRTLTEALCRLHSN